MGAPVYPRDGEIWGWNSNSCDQSAAMSSAVNIFTSVARCHHLYDGEAAYHQIILALV